MQDYAQQLVDDGVTTMPILSEKERKLFRGAFIKARENFPEYIHTPEADSLPFVLGGFGAYGNPSSFHNGYIRTLRLYTAKPMILFFSQVIQQLETKNNLQQWFLEQLFDRMCCRKTGSSTSAESVHRDLNPQTAVPTEETIKTTKKKNGKTVEVDTKIFVPRESDYCFGGWINLDETDQRFSCVLGSHTDQIVMTKGNTESGFATNERLERPITVIRVPPGHIVVFFQRIQHIVTPSQQKQDSFRQFRCWRLFQSLEHNPEPLNGSKHFEETIRDFGVPRLPSRQIPPMYSSNHTSVFLFKNNSSDPIVWSDKKIISKILETKVCKSGKNKGVTYSIVPRFLESLRVYNLQDSYPEYTEQEKNLLKPSNRWEIPKVFRLESVDDILSFRDIHSDACCSLTLTG